VRLAVLCQEEPVFLGPFLRGVIAAHPERIAAVFLAGRRSAGRVRTEPPLHGWSWPKAQDPGSLRSRAAPLPRPPFAFEL